MSERPGQQPDLVRRRMEWAWERQRIWSLTANRLKTGLDRARSRVLVLGIATAVLAVAATQAGQVSEMWGRVASVAAAVTAAVGVWQQRRVTTDSIRNWTRARSASEALKSLVYTHLATAPPQAGSDSHETTAEDPADVAIGEEARRIVEDVTDLQRHTLDIDSDGKPLPEVHDVESYIALRVNQQIDAYYRPKAAVYERRVRRLRALGDLLGILAAVLAAAAAAFGWDELAAWVPVVTTAAGAMTAHIAAARYDHLVIEYLRTAQRLAHLRGRYLDSGRGSVTAVRKFVYECEAAISVENQGWMARWTSPPGKE